jgi:hypothetical protein
MAVNVAGNAPFQRFRAKADDLSNYAGINLGCAVCGGRKSGLHFCSLAILEPPACGTNDSSLGM